MKTRKPQSFEDFLMATHAEDYIGLDDDMSDSFDNWLGDLDNQEIFDYAQTWGDIITNTNTHEK